VEVNKEKLRFFRTPSEFRRWLEKNHNSTQELWIGFYRKDSGKGGMTYHEALDEALCFGWIDGIRKKVDEHSFTNRFTPRKKNSIWSNVNVAHIERLTREGRMMAPGIAAFNAKDEKRAGVYSFEREKAELEPKMKKRFRQNPKAWRYFEAQPPYYRRMAAWWIISAKRDETREKRLAELIRLSSKEMRLAPFATTGQKKNTK
jgi:uncharacterized protein YdeI (YjbR/CyaY-like superfamily)